eukprot:CAMPEP_0202970208 /NCGR_PEP_ID=MMETSP1396-20130829/16203_1 /ASSEMBLY_ACC=CAM_ASM_000872 /TAXON_ID= /ORGANISM="Pseudokeronopsis sp., Strain Brazil" /LENGTH=74 /DNA_ID=CAMNT_0049698579 /DNA_START=100 /DNA_END=324 /DNA_ORIENTATION=-
MPMVRLLPFSANKPELRQALVERRLSAGVDNKAAERDPELPADFSAAAAGAGDGPKPRSQHLLPHQEESQVDGG